MSDGVLPIINGLPVGDANPFPIKIVSLPPSLEFNYLSGIVGNIETQVFQYTNNTQISKKINLISGESNVRSEWFIYIDDVLKIKKRTSVSSPNLNVEMYEQVIPALSNIKVKMIHYENFTAEASVTLNYHD